MLEGRIKKTTMKTSAFILTVAFLLSLGGCTAEEDILDNGGSNSDPAKCLHGTYLGTAQVKLRYFDPFGVYLGEKNLQFQAKVLAGKPSQLKTAPVGEDNPFNLNFFSVNQSAEGAFNMMSGLGFTDPKDGRELFLQYWDFDWNKTNGSVSGKLTDTGNAQALTLNLINIQDLFTGFVFQNTMKLQTTLTGTITCDKASLKLKGQSKNEIVTFEIIVEASK